MPETNPLSESIRIAARNIDRTGDIFSSIGLRGNDSARLQVAYRNATRAMSDVMGISRKPAQIAAAREIMAEVKSTAREEIRPALSAGALEGSNTARAQVRAYGLRAPVSTVDADAIDRAWSIVEMGIDEQSATLEALLLADASPSLILGDEDRIGVLRLTEILTTAGFWIIALLWDNYYSYLKGRVSNQYNKQAIAALDERTTDCCLRVHGQVQPLNVDFHLTGTPRFADRLANPPFHWNCRTAQALYLAAFDDGITESMRASAALIMAERAAGGTGFRHPAWAEAS